MAYETTSLVIKKTHTSPLKNEINPHYTYSVRSSQKKKACVHYKTSTGKIPYREIIVVYVEKHLKHIDKYTA